MLPHDHCIIVHAKDEAICCNIKDKGKEEEKRRGGERARVAATLQLKLTCPFHP